MSYPVNAAAAALEGEEDQMTKTHVYAKEHHLNELFVHFLQLLLYYRPDHPRAFLVEEIRKIREQKVSSSLFTEKDLETMFDLIDVTRQQTITITQLRNACRNLSTSTSTSASASTSPSPAPVAAAGAGVRLSLPESGDEELEAAIADAADEKGLVTLEKFKAVLAMLLVTKNMWSE